MRRFFLMFIVLSGLGWSQPTPQSVPPIVVKVEMPTTPNRDWLGYLQSLGPSIAALVALSVGLTQWYLQKQHLKQQMFAKRFEVYTAVRHLLFAVLTNDGFVEGGEYDRFVTETSPAKFLFGSEVTAFINGIKASDATTTSATYGETIRHILVGLDDDAATFFMRWSAKAELAFGPDLQLHDQGWLVRFIARVNRWVDQERPAKMASRYDA